MLAYGVGMVTGRTKTPWWGVVLNTPDPSGLAHFYSQILGWEVVRAEKNQATIRMPNAPTYIAFQRDDDFVPPSWPTHSDHVGMTHHLDIGVDDLALGVEFAISIGATEEDFQPQEEVRVLRDPSGHLLCLYLDHDPSY